jgi:hypothetical protein
MRYMISSMLVMINHVEKIMQQIGQLIISYKLDTTGEPFIKMLNNTLHIVMNVKKWGFPQRLMRCLYKPKYNWNHLTSGAWTS